MSTNNLQMVVTDLDGTLLSPQHQISEQDLQSLKMLGKKNVFRVVATGRSLYSVKRVIQDGFPIDYLIFSSGAGIIDWNTNEIVYSQSLNPAEVVIIANLLISRQIDFMIHKPIPENHKFVYSQTRKHNPDFYRRIKLYQQFAKPLTFEPVAFGDACQFIAIIPSEVSVYEWIKNELPDFKVIRTTSPLDGNSIWIEIFPEEVSKGSATEWLCNKLKINQNSVLGIGNDYNDLDLLNWTQHSYVVENAPPDLKQKFEITESNTNNGFTKAVMTKFSV